MSAHCMIQISFTLAGALFVECKLFRKMGQNQGGFDNYYAQGHPGFGYQPGMPGVGYSSGMPGVGYSSGMPGLGSTPGSTGGVALTECRKQSLSSGPQMPGSFVPECDQSGNFKKLQCNYSTGYCYCVDPVSGVKTTEGPGERDSTKLACH